MARWFIKNNTANIALMSERLNISPILAKVLANRGILSKSSAENYLQPNMKNLVDSSLMKDIDIGVEIIKETIAEKKKIMIYGDYDADGVMSTVILYKFLERMGADVSYYIPEREEGYGLNINAVKKINKMDTELLIACDNGISAIDEIKYAKELGIKTIIIDHHEPRFNLDDDKKIDILPEADAIIDPKQTSCDYHFKHLCAGGISYKFVKYYHEKMKIKFDFENEYLIFAAIATICDIVDLKGENRIIAKNGLDAINIGNIRNIGLEQLMINCELDDKELSSSDIGFKIGPCINAAGRLETAETSVELFLTQDEQKAADLAKKLSDLNNERKNITEKSVNQAMKNIYNSELKDDKVIVYYDSEIHESIAGIAAGRIKEDIYRPTIVIADSGKLAKGSGRSIEGYNLFEELYNLNHLFDRFGGHEMAAGLSLEHKNIPILREELNKNCKLEDEDFIPIIKIDEELSLEDLTFSLADELTILEPFGKGNSEPLFGSKNLVADIVEIIGKRESTLRFTFSLENSNRLIKAVCFNQVDKFRNMLLDVKGKTAYRKFEYGRILNINMDAVYSLGINEYKGNKYVSVKILDFRLT